MDRLLEEMNKLMDNFIKCRSHFPNVNEKLIGEKCCPTAEYYREEGYDITFLFDKPLSRQDIDKINEVGHWINQNFILRLGALLESRGMYSNKINIDHSIEGASHLDLVRRLRNYFAHTSSGKYNANDRNQLKTMSEMGKILDIDTANRSDFPLRIDKVLRPLFDGCKNYVKGKRNIEETDNKSKFKKANLSKLTVGKPMS